MKNAIINNKKVPWVEVEVMNQKKNTPNQPTKKKKKPPSTTTKCSMSCSGRKELLLKLWSAKDIFVAYGKTQVGNKSCPLTGV